MTRARLLACVFAALGCASPSKPAPTADPKVEQGATVYARYCALCHGAKGEGYTADNANALTNQDFLAISSDEFLRKGIVRGRPGTPMSAWGKSMGGPLDDAEVDALIAFLRSQQTVASIDLSKVKVGTGSAPRGQAAYNVECVGCHGNEGTGGKFMSIANPELLASASDAFLRQSIVGGRRGTPMAGYAASLTEQSIDDLVTLVRSWAKPPGSTSPELPSKDLGNPVLNPKGPEPVFDSGRFVKVDALKAELDRTARMIILDARPPADYVGGHIAGAVSVPFYLAKDYLPQLPKDVWIVAYCACPHAESGAAADTLMANGYTKVKVLDEGLPLWKGKGYPMTAGIKP